MTYRDTGGNVQVDFVWGNMPMQPDDDRETSLDPALDSHEIATTGWSNFPGYIPNYAGDGDTGFEVVVPNFVRLTLTAADDLAQSKALQLYTFSHVLTINYLESTGKTVKVWAYDTDYGNWSNESGAALLGLRVGDQVELDSVEYDSNPVSFGVVTVTAVNNDGGNSWFEFKLAEAPETAYDDSATGTVYAGPNLVDIVTVQRPNQTAPGAIVDEGRNVNIRYFSAL